MSLGTPFLRIVCRHFHVVHPVFDRQSTPLTLFNQSTLLTPINPCSSCKSRSKQNHIQKPCTINAESAELTLSKCLCPFYQHSNEKSKTTFKDNCAIPDSCLDPRLASTLHSQMLSIRCTSQTAAGGDDTNMICRIRFINIY